VFRRELLPDLSDVEIDEGKLMQVAKLAEVGMSVAAVTHELRQPLAALKIALQLAGEKAGSDDEMTKDLADALEQAIRMEMLLERTRSFLSPPCGKEPTDLSAVMANAAGLLRWQLERRRRVELQIEIDEAVPAISADASMLEQMIANLLFNARDAVSQQGGGRIVALVRRSGKVIEIVVADNGPGVDPRLADKIFTPFFTTKAADSGTGLGLYIARCVAADHGAELRLMTQAELSALGKGRLTTGFCACFPLAVDTATAPPPRPQARSAEAKARRVLLVDDEPAIVKLLGKLLATDGFEVVTAASGEEALERLEGEEFSLLVTDKNLPGLSGIEVARFARNIRPFMPVLLITGYASEDSALEALSLGVSDYVVKPLDVDDFRGRLAKVMGRENARDKVRAAAGSGTGKPPVRGKPDPAVPVLVFEAEEPLRRLIADTLTGLGCRVRAFPSDAGITEPPPFQSRIARPDLLRRRKDWFVDTRDGVLGAIAIMDRSGVDKTIEAIHLGARGVMAPPFDEGSVAFDFRRAVARLLDDAGRGQ